MSRVINPNTPGKERSQLMKSAAIALRQLLIHAEPTDETRDLAAFIARALCRIEDGVERSVTAWEKRGYWLKADRFRLEWEWAPRLGKKLETALRSDDWAEIAALCAQIGERLQAVHIPKKPRMGRPWLGAWSKLKESDRN